MRENNRHCVGTGPGVVRPISALLSNGGLVSLPDVGRGEKKRGCNVTCRPGRRGEGKVPEKREREREQWAGDSRCHELRGGVRAGKMEAAAERRGGVSPAMEA
ncbi:hypothetical protein HAX54_016683 [Datura stramonium]|uniref:Uncharacterized protein n=1 Tax=Datura stramonium TaxID=4076 RepID=A0ABS8UJH4_DATST|nr:hypothetical protein [Datura stramonium]